jgi:hypothetical protein
MVPFETQWQLHVPPTLTFSNSLFCTLNVFIFVWFFRVNSHSFLNSVNQDLFATQTHCVFFVVEREFFKYYLNELRFQMVKDVRARVCYMDLAKYVYEYMMEETDFHLQKWTSVTKIYVNSQQKHLENIWRLSFVLTSNVYTARRWRVGYYKECVTQ